MTDLYLELPLDVAQSFGTMINTASSGKDAIPVLSQVKVNLNGKLVTAYSTDRHVATRATYELAEGDYPDVTFYFDANVAKFLKAIKPNKYFSGASSVTFSVIDDVLTVSSIDQSINYRQLTGVNYPPIETLIDDFKPATVAIPASLNLAMFVKIDKLRPIGEHTSWLITHSEPRIYGTSPAKPGPLLITNGNMEVLAQPNYVKTPI